MPSPARQGSGTFTGQTTCQLGWDGGGSSTEGAWLVAVVGVRNGDRTLTGPSGWATALNQSNGAASDTRFAIFYKENASSVSSVTVTLSSASDLGMWIAEYSGILTSGSLDRTVAASGDSTSPASGSTAATQQADELVIAGIATRSQTVQSSFTGGHTLRANVESANATGSQRCRLSAHDRTLTATGTHSIGCTLSGGTSNQWAAGVATFRLDTGGGSPTSGGPSRVQRGTATLGAGSGSVDVTLPITLTDTAKSVLWWSCEPADTDANAGNLAGRILSTTTLRFSRYTGSGAPAVNIAWQVVEYASGVTVQRGFTTMAGPGFFGFTAGTTVVDVPIASVDTAKSFVLLGGGHSSNSEWTEEHFVSGRLTSGSNLRLERDDEDFQTDVAWQVVEYTNSTVQSGTTSFASGDTSKTATITSVTTAKTLVMLSYEIGAGSAVIGRNAIRGELTNATTLTFTRESSGVTADVRWFAISFTDDTVVQRNTLAWTSQTSQAPAITAVDPNLSWITAGGFHGRCGSTPRTSDDDPTVTTFKLVLASTSFTATRGSSVSNATLAWQVAGINAPTVVPGMYENEVGHGSSRGTNRGVA